MKHKDLKFGQIVETQADIGRFMVLGTVYERCYADVMYDFDFMPCVLYRIGKKSLEEVLDECLLYNNIYMRSITSLKEVKMFTKEEFLLHQEKCKFWFMKSRLVLNKKLLNTVGRPEENYQRLLQERKVINDYEKKFDKCIKVALLRQPLTTDLKEKRIYLPQNVNPKEDKNVVFYKYNKIWYRMHIEKPYGNKFLHGIYKAEQFDCDEKVALIDTNLDIIDIQWVKNWYS